MILTVKRKEPMQIAEGKTSILKLCKEYKFAIEIADNDCLLMQDEVIDPRYDMVLIQSAEDYVEFDVITKEDYAANYTAL